MTDGLNQSRRVGKETSTTMTDISNAIPFFFHLLFDQPNMAALWELVKGDDTWFPSFPVACVRVQNWVLLHVSCKDGVSFLFSFLFFCLLGFFSVTGLGHHWQAKRTANELEASPRASSLTNPL